MKNTNTYANEIERLYDKMATEKKVNKKDIDIMYDILVQYFNDCNNDIDLLCEGSDNGNYVVVDTFIRWNIKVEVNKDDWYINSLWGDYFPANDWFLLLRDWALNKIDIEE